MTPSYHQAPDLSRFSRAVALRVLMVLCIALYSVWGIGLVTVVVHDHDESNANHHGESHHALDPYHDDHEDHHEGDEREHHHHLSCSSSVAMASVTPPSHIFSLRITLLNAMSFDEVCPSGPVFELIKPPQAS